MKTDAWLDTTALVDLEFRSTHLRRHILSLFPGGSTHRTSSYVLFEFARGVLRHYIRLHNKAADLDTLSSLHHYIGNCNVGSSRTASTMLGAYQDFVRFLERDNLPLTPRQQLELFRSWLAPHIRRGWKRAARLATANPIGCRDDLPPPRTLRPEPTDPTYEHISHELPTNQCGMPDNCRLVPSLQQTGSPFSTLSHALAAVPSPDSETIARIPALQRLMTQPEAARFDRKDCYRCGDVIIAGEAPAGTTVLSKNAKHFQPLCDAMLRPLLTYKEPPPAGTNTH